MFEDKTLACKVPFQPREDRPVYCSDCFARMKQN